MNAAVSSPFTLADDGWGTPQFIMLAAGLLMVAAILIPPVIVSTIRCPVEPTVTEHAVDGGVSSQAFASRAHRIGASVGGAFMPPSLPNL